MLYLITILLAAVTSTAQIPIDQSDKEGTLETVLVDLAGRPVSWGTESSIRAITNGRLGPPSRVGRKAKLKYGTYSLTVVCPGAYTVEKTLKIAEPYQVAVVAVVFATPENVPTKNSIRGRIAPESLKKGCHLVRLVSPVSESEFANTIASDSGVFVFEDVKPGRYILATLGDQGLCDVTPTTITGEPNQELPTH
jgi:hypothetical protein